MCFGIFVIKKYHSFSNVTSTCLSEPLFTILQGNQNRAHLSRFDTLDWHPVAMNTNDLNNLESGLRVGTHQGFLIDPKDTFVDYTCQDHQVILLFVLDVVEGLVDVELSAV